MVPVEVVPTHAVVDSLQIQVIMPFNLNGIVMDNLAEQLRPVLQLNPYQGLVALQIIHAKLDN
jgi:hypothetical protein